MIWHILSWKMPWIYMFAKKETILFIHFRIYFVTVQCTMYTLHWALNCLKIYNDHCTVFREIVQCKLCVVQCTLDNCQYILDNISCTVYTGQWTMYIWQCMLENVNVHCAMLTGECTMYIGWWTMDMYAVHWTLDTGWILEI